MAEYYAQKNEYEKLLQEAKELGLQWSFNWLNNLDYSKLKEKRCDIEVSCDNHRNGQEQKDQLKLDYIKKMCPKKSEFEWTTKHHLSKSGINTFEDKYEIIKGNVGYTIIAYNRKLGWLVTYLHKYLEKDENGKVLSGKTELKRMEQAVPQLKEYRNPADEGYMWKQEIKKFFDTDRPECIQKVFEEATVGKTYYNVCSLDIHSAYPYALTQIVPETEDYILNMYNQRKEEPSMKQRMVYSIGTMESEKTQEIKGIRYPYAYAHLNYRIKEYTSNRLRDTMRLLEDQGAVVLMFCTDSIKFLWFSDFPPVGIDYGNGLGQWELEYFKTQFRVFSVKSYQYIGTKGKDEGKHIVKHSGSVWLDQVKPREQWAWDDMLNLHDIKWVLTDDLKIVWTGEDYE
ncbi:MAG: hypothetical protein K6G38_02040 [Gammaproteobacteria bacterium]|nr:hypothetical protein [Gammaproteobacteria bacterium]